MANEALLFPSFEQTLKAEQGKSITWEDYPYFLKGDISGIQEFIFSVKSKRASRTLKGRSFFIQALSELCIELIERKVGAENVRTFYNGGGNFYLLLKDQFEDELKEVRSVINNDCRDQEFYLTISVEGSKKSFAETWEEIHKKSNEDKLARFSGYPDAFIPYEAPYIEKDTSPNEGPFEAFTHQLIKAEKWDIYEPEKKPVFVGYQGVSCFDGQFKFGGKRDFRDIVYKLPVWNEHLLDYYGELCNQLLLAKDGDDDLKKPEENHVIEFEYLAEFAGKRTGTPKLAALKMDVDNLGKLFQNIQDPAKADKLSKYIKAFFGEFVKQLLEKSFEYTLPDGQTKEQERFFDNIYVVFAGGDDCFFLGGWDAVFEFASRFHREFEAFSDFLRREIGMKDPVTISAALVMVGPKFPINRFAAMVEEDLHRAKEENEKEKNRIAVFDKVMTWDSFEGARALAKELAGLIYQGENRAILERLQYESTLFDEQIKKAAQGLVRVNSSWRLLYTIKRNIKKDDNKDALEKVVREYTAALVASFVNQTAQQTPHIHKMPVAARWAEFLTRIKIDKTADSYEQIES